MLEALGQEPSPNESGVKRVRYVIIRGELSQHVGLLDLRRFRM